MKKNGSLKTRLLKTNINDLNISFGCGSVLSDFHFIFNI